MGNDGGSIPTRRELVKSAARNPTVSELKATALEALTHAWHTDPVSGDLLDFSKVVSDWRGRLYNYETVLQGLMPAGGEAGDKTEDKHNKHNNSGAAASGDDAPIGRDLTFAETGIRSLRDVVRLHGKPYTSNVSLSSSSKGAAADAPPPWVCPVSLKELGPASKSVYLVPCGHVFSEVAVETILPDRLCPECSTAVEPTDVVPILPADPAELASLRKRIEALRADGLTHSRKKDKSGSGTSGDKKSKKSKRKSGAVGDSSGEKDRKDEKDGKDSKRARGDDADSSAQPPSKKKKDGASGAKTGGISSRINNPMTASLTAKVLAEQAALQRQRKLADTRG